jgi:hypothetical protein
VKVSVTQAGSVCCLVSWKVERFVLGLFHDAAYIARD